MNSGLARHLLKRALIISLAAAWAVPLRAAPVFTVRDSIEMERFNDPSARDPAAQVKYSPDSRHFLIITSRGLIDSGQVESTLWLFNTSSVAHYVSARDGAPAPQPAALVRLRGKIQSYQGDSYGSLITSATWSTDSKSIIYLGQNGSRNPRLFRVDIGGGSPVALTPAGQNVSTFDVKSDVVVYTAIPSPPLRRRLNRQAEDITGKNLSEILFPTREISSTEHLFVHRGRAVFDVKDPYTGLPLNSASAYHLFSPKIAPNARAAVVPLPVGEIPANWASYTPAMEWARLVPKPATPENKSEFTWPKQYGLLNLADGSLKPLISAPVGWMTGFSDALFVSWAPDNSAILVSNSYLPLSKDNSKNPALLPCTAVVVRLPQQEAECVVLSRSPERDSNHRLYLVPNGGEFVGSANELRLRFWNENKEIQTDTYRFQGGSWIRLDTVMGGTDRGSGLNVNLEQTLNSPPALWATDESGHKKKFWSPAHQIEPSAIGEASIYKWKDDTGYEWIGGLIKPVGYRSGVRYPIVIQTHGFHSPGEFITDGAYTTAFAARELASAGFVVLELRDRHDHTLSPAEAADMVRGFESAIDQLSQAGLIDSQRVGIIGFSRTCYYVESAIIHAPSRYAAASISDGIDESYLQSIMFDVNRSNSEGSQIYGAPPFGEGLANWVSAAPGFHLDKVHTPLMISAIAPMSVLEEWEIYSSLHQQGKPVSFFYMPHDQHILQNPLVRLASQQANVDWFRFWLQGYEDPDPAKREQYVRWEGLCDMQRTENPTRPAFCVASRTH